MTTFWLCEMGLECVPGLASDVPVAKAEFQKFWEPSCEKGWDQFIIAETDEDALIKRVNTRFKLLFQADCKDPLIKGAASIGNPISQSVWRIGSIFHSSRAPVKYVPDSAANGADSEWTIPYGNGGKAPVFVFFRFREMISPF